jgi:putative Holliday junction resolvase
MKRALGIDNGDVRVGVAISDELGFLAHPLETIDVRHTNAIERLRQLAADRDVETIVVGMPRNMNGSHGPASEKAAKLAADLRIAIPACRIVTWDERLTTVSAQRSLQEAGRKAKDQKGVIDQAAAQVILQSWLDAQAGGLSTL